MPDTNHHPVLIGRSYRPGAVGLAAGVTLFCAAVVSITTVRQTARAAIDQEVRDNLARLAGAVAATIDPEAHAFLTHPDQEWTDDYRVLNEPLTKVIHKTDGVRFVYTLRAVGEHLHFILDGTPMGDADGDGIEDHSFLMELYEDPDPAAWEAILYDRVTVTTEPYTDLWGTFLSGFAPIRLPDGTVDGAVGVDVSASEYASRLASVDRAAAWALVPGFMLSLLVGGIAHRVMRRMRAHAAELERHRAEAERANRAKSALLANISHELRTPLTAIMGFVEIAVDPAAKESDRAEAIATVRGNAEHLQVLIGDLLDMSKAEAGAIAIEPVTVDLHELVRSAVAPLRLRANDKRVAMEVEGVDSLPAEAVLDPIRTRQILLNLLGNAVKFTDRGFVRLSLAHERGELVFRVADTGPGMDAEQMSRLFQPFSQVGDSSAKRHEGTGLGLAISQHLAGLMGGRISVESSPGRGSEFTLRIPFTEPVEQSDAGLPHGDCLPAGPLGGRRVLLAEDGADNRRLLRHILTRAGAEVEEHPDGRSALEALFSDPGRADLVLTDWDMPVLDGAGLVRALRAAGWRGPVVSLTAHAMDEQRQQCEQAGCDAHLTKPIDWEKLVDTCVALIEGRGRRAA
ncbi:MAG: response regulator [Phycisphaerales bacterium]|nr:response regulator [Planctomycetota bacterium]MCH8509980.1 response regulator [Phycisphaerales bacterium]